MINRHETTKVIAARDLRVLDVIQTETGERIVASIDSRLRTMEDGTKRYVIDVACAYPQALNNRVTIHMDWADKVAVVGTWEIGR